jgi:hypothetical protein
MRALKIDCVNKSISTIDFDASDYKNIAKEIGCEYIEGVGLMQDDMVFIDEEGRINGKGEAIGGFQLVGPGGTVECAGNGLILGGDNKGDTVAAKTTMGWACAHVNWLSADWFKANPCPPPTFHSLDSAENLLKVMGLV